MTQLGTFWEGIILVALAIICAVLSELLHINYLLTAVAPGLLAIGVAYVSGGAAGQRQMLRKLNYPRSVK